MPRESQSEQSEQSEPSRPVSPRELEVLRLVALGLSGREVAERLYRSQRTVESHLRSVYRKLGAHNRVEMLNTAARLGLLADPGGAEPPPDAQLEIKGQALEVLLMLDARLADVSHAEYFTELARALAALFEVRWAGVTEASPGKEQLDIIAFAADGVLNPRTVCRRTGSPCGETLSKGEVVALDDLRGRFPAWPFFEKLPARAYVGVRLDDRLLGPVGSLWIAHDQPIAERRMAETILKLIGRRAAAELALSKTLNAMGDDAPTEFGPDEGEAA